LISEATEADLVLEPSEQPISTRVARILSIATFASLLTVVAVGVIPYGGAEFWWKALLICCIFACSILSLLESYLTNVWSVRGGFVLVPLMVLALFGLLQTFSFGAATSISLNTPFWNSISADPFSTRFFVLQLLALILLAAQLYRYTNTDLRLHTIVNLIVAVAALSALYGIIRQTTQHSAGFGLPLLKLDQGYGQFVNKNHFAFLMEMGFGLALGMIIGGGVNRERGLIYLGGLLPIWTALVLSNSRGGLLAMFVQIVSAVLLFGFVGRQKARWHESGSLRLIRSLPARVGLLIVLVASVAFGTLWLGGDRLATKLEQANHEFDPIVAEVRQNARRNQIWQATWTMFTAHPIAGVGLGAYWIAIPQFHDASGTLTPQEAHNDYLELLSSGGLIGFALGVWFLALVYRRVRQNLSIESRFRRAAVFGATLALIGVAVHSLVDFGLHVLGNAIIFTALIVIATAYVPAKTRVLAD
jgi:O-antigen ligase